MFPFLANPNNVTLDSFFLSGTLSVTSPTITGYTSGRNGNLVVIITSGVRDLTSVLSISGFTKKGSLSNGLSYGSYDSFFNIFWKIANNEPSSYTLGFTAPFNTANAMVFSFRNASTNNPITNDLSFDDLFGEGNPLPFRCVEEGIRMNIQRLSGFTDNSESYTNVNVPMFVKLINTNQGNYNLAIMESSFGTGISNIVSSTLTGGWNLIQEFSPSGSIAAGASVRIALYGRNSTSTGRYEETTGQTVYTDTGLAGQINNSVTPYWYCLNIKG